MASRLRAWRQAVQPTDGPPVRLRGAAGITLAALDPGDVAARLGRDASGEQATARWAPVVAALGSSSPVGQALRSPLLAGLARAIYNPGGTTGHSATFRSSSPC